MRDRGDQKKKQQSAEVTWPVGYCTGPVGGYQYLLSIRWKLLSGQ